MKNKNEKTKIVLTPSPLERDGESPYE